MPMVHKKICQLLQECRCLFCQTERKRHSCTAEAIQDVHCRFRREEQVSFTIRKLWINTIPGFYDHRVFKTGKSVKIIYDHCIDKLLIKRIMRSTIFV